MSKLFGDRNGMKPFLGLAENEVGWSGPNTERGSEQAARIRRRLRRARATSLSALGANGVGILVNLFSIPLAVSYLGPARYGVLVTLNSLLAWLAMSNVGFGSALINALAEADGRNDDEAARGLVATAFWTLTGIAVTIGLLALVLAPHVDWLKVLAVRGKASAHEIRWAVALAFTLFCLSFPTSLADSIYRGYQEGYKENSWLVVGYLLSFVSLVVATGHRGGLPMLVLAMQGTVTAVRFANAVYLVAINRPWLLPSPCRVSCAHFSRLWNLGAFYMLQQLGNVGMLQVQPFLLSHFRGSVEAGQFSVAYRFLTVPVQLLLMVLLSFVGAYGEARARGEWNWLKHMLRKSIQLSLPLAVFLGALVAVTYKPIVVRWVGAAMVAEPWTIVWLTIYVVANGITGPFAIFLQGLERAREMAWITIANALFTVITGSWLVLHFGTPGMALAMALALTLVTAPLAAIVVLRVVREARRIEDSTLPCEKCDA